MKTKTNRLKGKLISVTIIGAAIILAIYAWHQRSQLPSTDDASINADVTHIAVVPAL